MEVLFIASPTRSLPLPVLYSSTHKCKQTQFRFIILLRVLVSLFCNRVYDFLCKASRRQRFRSAKIQGMMKCLLYTSFFVVKT